MLTRALGHGYSRQSVLRLLESGILAGHQMKPRGRWWILSNSVNSYSARILAQDAGEAARFSGSVRVVNTGGMARVLM
jgi:hypothetical protein